MGEHKAMGAQHAGACAVVQTKEQDWPGGVVPLATVDGAALQPGAGGCGGGAIGGGAGGGTTGGGAVGGLSGGRLTGSSTLAAKPDAPP